MAVTTTEGIGIHRNKNPIQERIVEHNGSQCGFCTPGFVMTMYGLLRANPNPSHEEIEKFFDGNLCRCTGFRPILDAMQSFVGDTAATKAAVGTSYSTETFGPPREFEITDGTCIWQRVTSVPKALAAMRRADGKIVRLVNGNTSVGIYKRPLDRTDIFLDISQIPKLQTVYMDAENDCLTIGGGVTYSVLQNKLGRLIPLLPVEQARSLQVLRKHVERIAGHQVRNVGTVGGNIMLVLSHVHDDEPFPSDLFTVLATLDAKITLRQPCSPEDDEVYGILDVPPLACFPDGYLLTAIKVPLTRAPNLFDTYKVARRFQNSHAIVNAGFLIRTRRDQTCLPLPRSVRRAPTDCLACGMHRTSYQWDIIGL